MKTYFSLLLAALLLFTCIPEKSNAAFRISPAKNKTELTATQPAKTTTQKKPFSERKIPQFVKKLAHNQTAYTPSGQPGWPGTLSLVFGICGFVFLFIPFLGIISFPLLLAAIIFGAIGLNAHKYSNTGMALAGLLIGAITILLAIVLVILLVSFFAL